jgi:hypothetical protein
MRLMHSFAAGGRLAARHSAGSAQVRRAAPRERRHPPNACDLGVMEGRAGRAPARPLVAGMPGKRVKSFAAGGSLAELPSTGSAPDGERRRGSGALQRTITTSA